MEEGLGAQRLLLRRNSAQAEASRRSRVTGSTAKSHDRWRNVKIKAEASPRVLFVRKLLGKAIDLGVYLGRVRSRALARRLASTAVPDARSTPCIADCCTCTDQLCLCVSVSRSVCVSVSRSASDTCTSVALLSTDPCLLNLIPRGPPG